ncbi:MAG: hypothetical protein PHQ40_04415 [Anaerolineaceae bacterium]|nr:hypothetical protein [Anaerolineaceae bacterium]
MTWDLVGHSWAVEMLQTHVTQGTQRQAYLFSGPPGAGRRTLALRFIQALSCPTQAAPGVPCGACRTCQQIARMQYSDLFVVQKLPDKTEVGIDQVRALQHTLSLAPYAGPFRFGLLLNFDQASEGAMNSLLKVLEEPSSRAILILTAETPEALRRTIVSRCEVFRLRPLPLNQLAEYLEHTQHAAAPTAQLLSHLASGRPGYALKMLNQPQSLEQRRQWIADLLTLLPASRRVRFEYAARVADTRHSRSRVEAYEARATLREMFLNWLSFWSDVMLCTANVSAPLVNLDYEAEITRIAAPLDLVSARRVVLAIERSLQQLDANLTPRLVTEVLLLDWPVIPPG